MSEATTEEWRDVVGREGEYQVSSHGRVRSVDRTKVDASGRVRPLRGKLLALTSVDRRSGGHISVSLGRDERSSVHRLVALAFLGRPEPGQEVCHNDGNAGNNHVSNLRWDTRSANHRDTVAHGKNWKSNITHCPRGHELVAPNLFRTKVQIGHRQCRACSNVYCLSAARHLDRDSAEFQQMADRRYEEIMSGRAGYRPQKRRSA